MSISRSWFAWSLAIFMCTFWQLPACAQSPSSAPTPARSTVMRLVTVPGMTARLRANGVDYQVGDPILLEVTLENHGSSFGYLQFVSPEADFRLQVTGPNGQTVAPDPNVLPPGPFELKRLEHTVPVEVPPGRVVTSGYNGRTWTDLRTWHYDLRTPGRYEITAIRAGTSPPVRSNTVVVTIR